jgi:serine/threonine protein kinase
MLDQIIGKYRLTRFIGEGGMANVYEGTHITLGTKAAIKILNPILAKNEQFRQRFQNEAAFMASLDHPNITKVFDFEDDGTNFAIVMELLEGMDLNDWVKAKGAFNFETFKPILVQILQSFQYAHNKGILHRDIKPSNIFIDNNGKVKILDFGIAKLFGTGNEMTQTGTQMGTPAYMSPEQVRADKSIDHRSDIYSLGVTMYFALAGRSPYDTENESQFDIFNKIVFENLPELKDNDKANSIIKKACEKDRALRYQSVEEIELFLKSNTKTIQIQGNLQQQDDTKVSSKPNQVKSVPSSKKSNDLGKAIFIVAVCITAGVIVINLPRKNSYNDSEYQDSSYDLATEAAAPADSTATEEIAADTMSYAEAAPASEAAPYDDSYYTDIEDTAAYESNDFIIPEFP